MQKAEGWFVVEGGDGESASGIRDTTSPDLLGKEADKSGRMGGLTTHL